MEYLARSKRFLVPRPIQTQMAVSAARYASLMTLYGASGLGKTTAAVRAIVFRCTNDEERGSMAVSGMRLSRLTTIARAELVDRITYFQGHVLLDDIDKGSKAENVSCALLEIIEAREKAADWLTILTTNATGKQLKEKLFEGYGDPIVNRLARGICINFDPVNVIAASEMTAIREKLRKMYPHLQGEKLGDGII